MKEKRIKEFDLEFRTIRPEDFKLEDCFPEEKPNKELERILNITKE